MKPTILYRFYGTDDTLLYVGISHRIENRLGQHKRTKPWREVSWIKLEHFDSRPAALAAEQQAIRAEKPLWNKTVTSSRRWLNQSTRSDLSSLRQEAWLSVVAWVFSDLCNRCEVFGTDDPIRLYTLGRSIRIYYSCRGCGNQWFCSWGVSRDWIDGETVDMFEKAFPPGTAWIRHSGYVYELVFTAEMKEAMQPRRQDD